MSSHNVTTAVNIDAGLRLSYGNVVYVLLVIKQEDRSGLLDYK